MRVYTASFNTVAVSAVQDLLTVSAPATMALKILSATLSQKNIVGDANAEMFFIQLSRLTAAGTGGAAVTPVKHEIGDPAATATARKNDTTQGTKAAGDPLRAETFNVQAGYIYVPIPEEMIIVPPSGIISLSLDTAPAAATTMSGTLTFGEIG